MHLGRASLRLPARTIRLRLTLLYGLVFLVSGAVLLTIGYELVRHNLNGLSGNGAYRDELRRLGLPTPPIGRPPGFDARIAEAIRAQLRADALHRLLVEYIVALGAMTIVSVVAGWVLAGRALRPLRDITATARRVSGENLGERISLEGPADELKELADTFDGMLARLDSAFGSQRHFVANASHELRTPLAIMRTEVDVSLADPDATVDELRRMGEAVRETVDRCERLIEGLLMLARSEAAHRPRGAGRPGRAGRRLRHGPARPSARGRCRNARRPRAGLDTRRAGAARADDRQPRGQRHPPQPAGRIPDRDHAQRGRPRARDRRQRRPPDRPRGRRRR